MLLSFIDGLSKQLSCYVQVRIRIQGFPSHLIMSSSDDCCCHDIFMTSDAPWTVHRMRQGGKPETPRRVSSMPAVVNPVSAFANQTISISISFLHPSPRTRKMTSQDKKRREETRAEYRPPCIMPLPPSHLRPVGHAGDLKTSCKQCAVKAKVEVLPRCWLQVTWFMSI